MFTISRGRSFSLLTLFAIFFILIAQCNREVYKHPFEEEEIGTLEDLLGYMSRLICLSIEFVVIKIIKFSTILYLMADWINFIDRL